MSASSAVDDVGDHNDQVELELYPLPVSDPRYPLPTDWPDFQSPPEYLRGAFIPSPELVEEMQHARAEEGLSTDSGLIEELLRAEGASSQIRRHGLVLTDAEQVDVEARRQRSEAATELIVELSALDGWAGSQESEDGLLRLWVTERSRAAAEEILYKRASLVEKMGTVVLSIRDFSWNDLRSVSRRVAHPRDGEPVPGPEMDRAAVELGVQLANEFAPVTFGYSIRHGSLVVEVPDLDAVSRRKLQTSVDGEVLLADSPPSLPPVILRQHEPAVEDTGPALCPVAGCGPSRAGIRIEGHDPTPGGTDCTLGFAIILGSDQDFVTAGHCEGPSFFSPDLQQESGTYPSFFTWNRAGPKWAMQRNTNFNGSPIDAVEVGVPDHLVKNRVRDTANVGGIVTNPFPLSALRIGDDVCIRGEETRDCGEIVDFGATSNGITDLVVTDYNRTGGDSGAPIIWQSNRSYAVGIHKGFSPSAGGALFSSVSYVWRISNNLGDGIYTQTDRRRDFVNAVYVTGLGRFADAPGFSYWRHTTLSSCTLSRARSVVVNLLTSSEFRNNYSVNTLNGRRVRVEKAYRAILQRPSDDSGFSYWVSYIGAGGSTAERENRWSSTVLGFANGTEFSNRVSSGGSAHDGRIC